MVWQTGHSHNLLMHQSVRDVAPADQQPEQANAAEHPTSLLSALAVTPCAWHEGSLEDARNLLVCRSSLSNSGLVPATLIFSSCMTMYFLGSAGLL